MTKAGWKKRFKEVYKKGERLLAVQLNGFSHKVVYDDGKKNSVANFDEFSACMPEYSWDTRTAEFFKDIGHNTYQNNAQEIVFVQPNHR